MILFFCVYREYDKVNNFLLKSPLLDKSGALGRIRTCDLRIRSPLLYPAELRAHNKR